MSLLPLWVNSPGHPDASWGVRVECSASCPCLPGPGAPCGLGCLSHCRKHKLDLNSVVTTSAQLLDGLEQGQGDLMPATKGSQECYMMKCIFSWDTMTSRVLILFPKLWVFLKNPQCVGNRETGHLKPQHFVQQSVGKATYCASLLLAKSRIPLG